MFTLTTILKSSFFMKKLRVRLISNIMTPLIGPGYIVHGSKGSLIQERSDCQEQLLSKGLNHLKTIGKNQFIEVPMPTYY